MFFQQSSPIATLTEGFRQLTLQDQAAVLTLLVTTLALIVASIAAFGEVWPTVRERTRERMLRKQIIYGQFDKETIARAIRYYIKPHCTTVDSSNYVDSQENKNATRTTNQELYQAIDQFLSPQSSEKYLLLLADSGVGKTSFVLNYYAHNLRRRPQKRESLYLVYLGSGGADELIEAVEDKTDATVFLDALDEDPKAIRDYRARIAELVSLCRSFRRVVITCRSQFFPSDMEIPAETEILSVGPRSAGKAGIYEYKRLYIAPFSQREVRRYLRRRYPLLQFRQRFKAQQIAKRIPLICSRQMLLAHIPDLIDTERRVTTRADLYAAMIDAWLERERYWVVDTTAMRLFSDQLARDLLVNERAGRPWGIPRSELLVKTRVWGVNLDEWKLTSRSLLNRDSQGNYKFAHRSIAEYLCAEQLVQNTPGSELVPLTREIGLFVRDICNSFHSAAEIRLRHQEVEPSASCAVEFVRGLADITLISGYLEHKNGDEISLISNRLYEILSADNDVDAFQALRESIAAVCNQMLRTRKATFEIMPASVLATTITEIDYKVFVDTRNRFLRRDSITTAFLNAICQQSESAPKGFGQNLPVDPHEESLVMVLRYKYMFLAKSTYELCITTDDPMHVVRQESEEPNSHLYLCSGYRYWLCPIETAAARFTRLAVAYGVKQILDKPEQEPKGWKAAFAAGFFDGVTRSATRNLSDSVENERPPSELQGYIDLVCTLVRAYRSAQLANSKPI